MIMTDNERNSGKVFIPENRTFTVEDGTTFDLSDEYQKAEWESIKNCLLIAPSRYAKDENGNYLIDGTIGKNSTHQDTVLPNYISINQQQNLRVEYLAKNLYMKHLPLYWMMMVQTDL